MIADEMERSDNKVGSNFEKYQLPVSVRMFVFFDR
jgi:hypothetical protein